MATTKYDGVLSKTDIDKLTWPIAWSGTTPKETLLAEESARSALVAAAREAFDADPDAIAVEVVNGDVVATVHE